MSGAPPEGLHPTAAARRSRRRTTLGLMKWIAGFALALAVAINLLSEIDLWIWPAATRLQCTSNLKQIGIALYNYHEVQGCFPPAYVADAAGKPLYSWRVLILPYMDQQGLYQAFRLDEPWDSPSNRALLSRMPRTFGCPWNRNRHEEGRTDYLAISGPGTAFPGPQSATLAQFTDGTGQTLAVVESSGSDVHWSEPRDIPLGADGTLGPPGPNAGRHPSGPSVLFADGSVTKMDSGDLARESRPLATIGAGDVVPNHGQDDSGPPLLNK